jgi:hypothetical protein
MEKETLSIQKERLAKSVGGQVIIVYAVSK